MQTSQHKALAQWVLQHTHDRGGAVAPGDAGCVVGDLPGRVSIGEDSSQTGGLVAQRPGEEVRQSQSRIAHRRLTRCVGCMPVAIGDADANRVATFLGVGVAATHTEGILPGGGDGAGGTLPITPGDASGQGARNATLGSRCHHSAQHTAFGGAHTLSRQGETDRRNDGGGRRSRTGRVEGAIGHTDGEGVGAAGTIGVRAADGIGVAATHRAGRRWRAIAPVDRGRQVAGLLGSNHAGNGPGKWRAGRGADILAGDAHGITGERAIPVAQQDTDCLVREVRGDQVEDVIAIEVAHRHTIRFIANGVGEQREQRCHPHCLPARSPWCTERSVGDQVEFAIAIEVAYRHTKGVHPQQRR